MTFPTKKVEGVPHIEVGAFLRLLFNMRELMNTDPDYFNGDPDELLEYLIETLGGREE